MIPANVGPEMVPAGRARLKAALPYLVAYGLYIPLCVRDPRWMLSWAEGIAFLFVAAWLVPAAFNATRTRLSPAANVADGQKGDRR